MSMDLSSCECMYCKQENRARALLLSHLNEGQLSTFSETGYLMVEGSEGGFYRLLLSGSVERRRGGTDDDWVPYCVSPLDDYLPQSDELLTLMAWIQGDEQEFLAQANPL